jgi:hypothetical protein
MDERLVIPMTAMMPVDDHDIAVTTMVAATMLAKFGAHATKLTMFSVLAAIPVVFTVATDPNANTNFLGACDGRRRDGDGGERCKRDAECSHD